MAEDLTSEEEVVVDEFEDELDADEQLEEEAEEAGEQEPGTDAEEEPDIEVPEVDPAGAKIGEYRRGNRELKGQLATVSQQLADQAKVIEELRNPPPPPEKSPLEKLAEEDPDGDPDTQTLIAQSKWEQKQRDAAANHATTQQATTTRNEKIAASQVTAADTFSEAKVGMGVDFETVIAMGEKYLTEGEKLDIRNADADKVWDTAYRICRRAVLQSGKPDAKTLRSRINAHKAAGGNTKPGSNKKTKKLPGGQEKVVVNEEGNFAHITSFLFDGD